MNFFGKLGTIFVFGDVRTKIFPFRAGLCHLNQLIKIPKINEILVLKL